MKLSTLILGCASALALSLSLSCKVPGSETPSGSAASIPSVLISNYNGKFSYNLDVGSTPKDVYFVFSNTSLNTNVFGTTVQNASEAIKVDGTAIASTSAQPAGGPSASSTNAKDFLARTNRDPVSYITSRTYSVNASKTGSSAPSYDSVGTGASLTDIDSSGTSTTTVGAHCQFTRTISTAQGNRTLNIYLADDCGDNTDTSLNNATGFGTSKKHLVRYAMLTALADAFLKDGVQDIYAYDTNLLGPKWGDPNLTSSPLKGNLIPFTGDITILVSDIMADNSDTGGVVGYFWDLNNYKQSYYSNSNHRIMFVIDSVMFANPSTVGATGTGNSGWNASTSYWAQEVFSTLAHEFQHMIQFYQKGIVIRGDGQTADTWINEMCSQLVEDLVAQKMGVPGPRGVTTSNGDAGPAGNTYGRIPYFNAYLSSNDRQLTKTSNYDVLDYSFSYAFGAWLMRNYGGAAFVKNVVYDSATDSSCVTDAVSKASGRSLTMADLLTRWAVAVLGSDRMDMPPGYRYNIGGWTSSSAGGMTYNLGSMNFFNYSPAPKVLTQTGSVPQGSIAPAANVYYRAGSALTGSQGWSLEVPKGVSFSVFVTP